MSPRLPWLVVGCCVALSVVAMTACGVEKSRSPLSPSIAGPIEGVVISAPIPVTSGGNQLIRATEQPITLEFSAATSTGERPFWYEIEVSTSEMFESLVHAMDQVSPSGAETESYEIPEVDAEQQYAWRVRALDGANTGPYSEVAAFEVYTPVSLGQPYPVAPVGNARVSGTSVQLRVRNATVTGPAQDVRYEFEWAKDTGFTQDHRAVTVPAGASETAASASGLEEETRYYWRSRALADSREPQPIAGEWSQTESFDVYTPFSLGRPRPVAPVGNARISGTSVRLRVRNATVTGPAQNVRYEFEWAKDTGFTQDRRLVTVPAGASETSVAISSLEHDTRYHWRSRALADGREPQPIFGAWSRTESFRTAVEGPTGPGPCTGGNPPNMLAVIRQVAAAHPQSLANSCQDQGGSWDFMDRVVETLRSYSQCWGHNCKRGDCNAISQDVVDYHRGSGDGNGSTNVAIIDVIVNHCASNPQPAWTDVTHETESQGAVGRWKYPRR